MFDYLMILTNASLLMKILCVFWGVPAHWNYDPNTPWKVSTAIDKMNAFLWPEIALFCQQRKFDINSPHPKKV